MNICAGPGALTIWNETEQLLASRGSLNEAFDAEAATVDNGHFSWRKGFRSLLCLEPKYGHSQQDEM